MQDGGAAISIRAHLGQQFVNNMRIWKYLEDLNLEISMPIRMYTHQHPLCVSYSVSFAGMKWKNIHCNGAQSFRCGLDVMALGLWQHTCQEQEELESFLSAVMGILLITINLSGCTDCSLLSFLPLHNSQTVNIWIAWLELNAPAAWLGKLIQYRTAVPFSRGINLADKFEQIDCHTYEYCPKVPQWSWAAKSQVSCRIMKRMEKPLKQNSDNQLTIQTAHILFYSTISVKANWT